MASRVNPQNAVLNNSSSGNTTIITNPSTKAFMYIWTLYVVSGGTANLTFYNGAGPLSGPLPTVAGTVINPTSPLELPIFTIDPGASFIINDSAGVQKSGWCTYSN
jgi:hypothetical protein